MRQYYPHIAFYTLMVGGLIIGFAANMPAVGAFYGGIAGFLTDPVQVILSVVIGVACRRQWVLLLVAVVAALILTVVVHNQMAKYGVTSNLEVDTIMIRIFGILTVAYLANAVRLMLSGAES